MLAPDWSPVHLRLLGGSRFKPCLGYACLRPVAVVRLNVGDLHAVCWLE